MKKYFTSHITFQKLLLYLCSQEQIYKSLYTEKKFLCAFSGGQDSIFLVVFLLFFQTKKKIHLETFYYHHFLQILNFFSVWHAVRFHYLFHCPLSIGLGLDYLETENQARICRRKHFERTLQFIDTSTLLLGHTATDKIETFLGNLQRGMGSQGMNTISWKNSLENTSFSIFFSSEKKFPKENCFTQSFCFLNMKTGSPKITEKIFSLNKKKKKKSSKKSLFFFKGDRKFETSTRRKVHFFQRSSKVDLKIKIRFLNERYLIYSHYSEILSFKIFLLRPFLSFYRSEISELCDLFEFPLIVDPTNEVSRISRNRVRHQIIPLARYFYSKNFDFLLWKFLDIKFYEQESFQTINSILFNKVLIPKLEQNLSNSLANLSVSSQRFLIQKIFFQSTKRQLSYSQIEMIRKIFEKYNYIIF